MDGVPKLIESLKSNGGIRSVTRAVFPAGATAVKHYHTDYTEIFSVLEGMLTVIISDKEFEVRAGEKSPVIPTHTNHTYQNNSGADVEVDIILAPGHAGCEASNVIVETLMRENQGNLFSKKYSLFWISFYEITNTIPSGIEGVIFSILRLWFGKQKIRKYTDYLLRKAGHD